MKEELGRTGLIRLKLINWKNPPIKMQLFYPQAAWGGLVSIIEANPWI